MNKSADVNGISIARQMSIIYKFSKIICSWYILTGLRSPKVGNLIM